jgi:putative transcriptional regulator
MARGEGPERAVVALGYAGWSPGQLESEIAANAWLCAPADPAIIFKTPYEQRWSAAARLLGIDIHQITNYAGHA